MPQIAYVASYDVIYEGSTVLGVADTMEDAQLIAAADLDDDDLDGAEPWTEPNEWGITSVNLPDRDCSLTVRPVAALRAR
jgi:hypothetical protein